MRSAQKVIFLFLVFICSWHVTKANSIDSIKTKEDLFKFISFNFKDEIKLKFLFLADSTLAEVEHFPVPVRDSVSLEYRNKYGTNGFYKVDIDGNGKTDLVVDGSLSFVILDVCGEYQFHQIGFRPECALEKIIDLEDHSKGFIVSNERVVIQGASINNVSKLDTLIYKFGGLIEYYGHHSAGNIQRVDLWKHPACFGDCNELFLEINKNGDAVIWSSDSDEVRYASIDKAKMVEIWNLANSIDFKSIDTQFYIVESEAPVGYLVICYEDGSTKKIRDPGFARTVGLSSLYQKLFALQKSLKWRSWVTASPAMDTYLIGCPIAFLERNFQTRKENYSQRLENAEGQCYLLLDTTTDRQGIETVMTVATLNLFSDRRFQYSRSTDITCRKKEFSMGNWCVINDSTVELKWDAILTLKTARNKVAGRAYFDEEADLTPVRVENWKFVRSTTGNLLIRQLVRTPYGVFTD